MRYYTLALTDMGCEQQEFPTDAERQHWLNTQDATFDDFYCLDVQPDGSVEFFLADTSGVNTDELDEEHDY